MTTTDALRKQQGRGRILSMILIEQILISAAVFIGPTLSFIAWERWRG